MSKSMEIFRLLQKYNGFSLNGINGALAQKNEPFRVRYNNGRIEIKKINNIIFLVLGGAMAFSLTNVSMLTVFILSLFS